MLSFSHAACHALSFNGYSENPATDFYYCITTYKIAMILATFSATTRAVLPQSTLKSPSLNAGFFLCVAAPLRELFAENMCRSLYVPPTEVAACAAGSLKAGL